MPEELGPKELESLKVGASYELFLAETGEQLTEFVFPDEKGEIAFPMDEITKNCDVEIGWLTPDGMLILGERTTITVVE